jgi:hypothetical protein
MGRPPIFETPEQFKERADFYFDSCLELDTIPTVNGLCLCLGMCRDTLWEYAKKDDFSDAVKEARMRLEMAWELRLAGYSCTGAIFWLKNQGWSDKTEQTISGPNGGPVETVTRFRLADLE